MNPLPWLPIDPAAPPTEAGEYLCAGKYSSPPYSYYYAMNFFDGDEWYGTNSPDTPPWHESMGNDFTHYLPITPPVAGQTVHEAWTQVDKSGNPMGLSMNGVVPKPFGQSFIYASRESLIKYRGDNGDLKYVARVTAIVVPETQP
jgi:hypothetical protein